MAVRLPPDLLARIRAVLTPADDLIDVADWPELAHTLRARPVDLVIVDPSAPYGAVGQTVAETNQKLLALMSEFRSVPVVAYAPYTRESLRTLLALAHVGLHQVILRGFDDTGERLRDVIDQVAARMLGERILAVALPLLEARGTPPQESAAIATLFRSPQTFRTVPQLAAAAGRERGMLDRWLRRAGLAPAKVLILAARVAWAHQYAQSSGSRFKVLALRLGYPSSLPLSRHVKWMTGMTPTEMRRTVDADALVELLLTRIVRTTTVTG